MSELEHLYQAIVTSPADDTVRLVYADRLEEEGDAKRANFIRAQIEIARGRPYKSCPRCHGTGEDITDRNGKIQIDECDHCDDVMPAALADRVAKLFRSNTWGSRPVRMLKSLSFDYFGNLPSHEVARYVRGFIGEIKCSGGTWTECGPQIATEFPIEKVLLTSDPLLAVCSDTGITALDDGRWVPNHEGVDYQTDWGVAINLLKRRYPLIKFERLE